MKKTLLVSLFILMVVVGFIAWKVFAPSVKVPEEKYFFIYTGDNYDSVKKRLSEQKIIANEFWFDQTAKKLKYPSKVKAGRYRINEKMNITSLVRMLRSGHQSPLDLVITKIRLKEDLARLVGRKFECDSASMAGFLNNLDSLKSYGLDTVTVLSIIMPDTYSYFWNSAPKKIFDKLYAESQKFWNEERKEKAAALGLTPVQVYTLASIIDEETNYAPEKSQIACVYLNRLSKNMRLQADPTLKYSLRNFALKRLLNVHKKADSPYNTYKNAGLPPGPICSALPATIDAVLNAPKTDYLYFVAKSDFSGSHIFTSNYKDHMKYAREYSKALDSLQRAKQNAQ
jgi:UPF0755 protein